MHLIKYIKRAVSTLINQGWITNHAEIFTFDLHELRQGTKAPSCNFIMRQSARHLLIATRQLLECRLRLFAKLSLDLRQITASTEHATMLIYDLE